MEYHVVYVSTIQLYLGLILPYGIHISIVNPNFICHAPGLHLLLKNVILIL